jgi:hypothetical protein
MDDVQIQQVEQTVRFQHPEKLVIPVPHLDEPVIATILGLDVATYRRTKHQLEEQVRGAAGELLIDPTGASSVDRLLFRPGTMVVGVGDSNTDDLLSWLEIHPGVLLAIILGSRLGEMVLKLNGMAKCSNDVSEDGCKPVWAGDAIYGV